MQVKSGLGLPKFAKSCHWGKRRGLQGRFWEHAARCYTVQSKYRNHSLHQANTSVSVNWYQWSVLSSFQVWPPPHFAMWATSSLPFSFFLLLLSPYAYSHPGKSKHSNLVVVVGLLKGPARSNSSSAAYREMLNSNLNCHLRVAVKEMKHCSLKRNLDWLVRLLRSKTDITAFLSHSYNNSFCRGNSSLKSEDRFLKKEAKVKTMKNYLRTK